MEIEDSYINTRLRVRSEICRICFLEMLFCIAFLCLIASVLNISIIYTYIKKLKHNKSLTG